MSPISFAGDIVLKTVKCDFCGHWHRTDEKGRLVCMEMRPVPDEPDKRTDLGYTMLLICVCTAPIVESHINRAIEQYSAEAIMRKRRAEKK